MTFAALVPVAAVLSAVTPTVARMQLRDLSVSGTVVGRLSAWATAGALVGTFGTGFVLVPLLPVSSSVLAIGAILIFTGIGLGVYLRLLNRRILAATTAIALALALFTIAQHSPCEAETTYNCVRVEPDPERPTAELLILDREDNSEVEQSNPRYLGFLYTQWIGESIAELGRPGTPLDAIFVGGGGFTLPRWLEATRPGSHSNVLEVDGKLVEFDCQHFGLRTSSDLRATVGDARVTMRHEPSASTDVIVGDAFSGLTVPWQMMTSEWLHEVRRVLRPDGLYALNVIDEPPLKLLKAEAATVLAAFTKVGMVTFVGKNGRPDGGNAVMFASDGPLPVERGSASELSGVLDRAAVTRFVAGAKPLRDDYAPVDQLETRPPTQTQTLTETPSN